MIFEVFWSPLPDFVADPHTLSGFSHFKEVSNGTEHKHSESTQGSSGRNIQHEDGQYHLSFLLKREDYFIDRLFWKIQRVAYFLLRRPVVDQL